MDGRKWDVMRSCVYNLSKEEKALAFLNNIGWGTGGDRF